MAAFVYVTERLKTLNCLNLTSSTNNYYYSLNFLMQAYKNINQHPSNFTCGGKSEGDDTCVQNLMRTMYWLGVESRMIFMCSMTSLKGAMSFIRSWLVMVAGTVMIHTIALRLTSSVSDVILLQ